MEKTILLALALILHISCPAQKTGLPECIRASETDGINIDSRMGLSENKTRSLLIDKDDRVVVATSASIDIFDGLKFKSIPIIPEQGEKLLTHTNNRRLSEDRDLGILWLKTGILSSQQHSRLHALDPSTGKAVTKDALKIIGGPSTPWVDFFIDETGRYWVADSKKDLYERMDGKWRIAMTLNTLCKEEPYALSSSPDGKYIFILYAQGKVYCLEHPSMKARAIYKGPDHHALRGRTRWKDGKIYMAFSDDMSKKSEIIMCDPEKATFTLLKRLDYAINDFIFDKDGRLVTAASGGMPETLALAVDGSGGIWTGTRDNGLIYSNPQRHSSARVTTQPYEGDIRKTFVSERAKEYASIHAPDLTNCSTEDPTSGNTYLGTRKGILVIDSNGKLQTRIDRSSGLDSDNVVAIAATDTCIWFTTASSIGRLDKKRDFRFTLTSYGRLEGIELDGMEFNPRQLSIDSAGIITAGFPGGSCRFDPARIPTGGIATYEISPCKGAMPADSSKAIIWICAAAVLIISGAIVVYRKADEAPSEAHHSIGGQNDTTEPYIPADIDISALTCATPDPDEEFREKLLKAVDANIYDEQFNVQRLSDLMAMDRSSLYRRVQSLIGKKPSELIKERRLEISKALLLKSDLKIIDISIQCGYSSTRYYSSVFKKEYGMTPSEFRNAAKSADDDGNDQDISTESRDSE